MKVKRLFMGVSGHENKLYLETPDGNFYSFFISPFRNITEKDLTPAPYYNAKGNRAKENEGYSYMYRLYGLEKVKEGLNNE